MGVESPPSVAVAEEVLKELAPELAAPVHRFLHGSGACAPGEVVPTLPRPHDYSEASIKLRRLHDRFSEAINRREDGYHVAVLTTAVRLQAMILYDSVRRFYHDG